MASFPHFSMSRSGKPLFRNGLLLRPDSDGVLEHRDLSKIILPFPSVSRSCRLPWTSNCRNIWVSQSSFLFFEMVSFPGRPRWELLRRRPTSCWVFCEVEFNGFVWLPRREAGSRDAELITPLLPTGACLSDPETCPGRAVGLFRLPVWGRPLDSRTAGRISFVDGACRAGFTVVALGSIVTLSSSDLGRITNRAKNERLEVAWEE
jgi:hypothetical protein